MFCCCSAFLLLRRPYDVRMSSSQSYRFFSLPHSVPMYVVVVSRIVFLVGCTVCVFRAHWFTAARSYDLHLIFQNQSIIVFRAAHTGWFAADLFFVVPPGIFLTSPTSLGSADCSKAGFEISFWPFQKVLYQHRVSS